MAKLGELLDRLRQNPRRFILIADGLFIALIIVAIGAELVGDFRTTIVGIRISVRSVWRIAIYAAVLTVLRHLIVPKPSLIERVFPQSIAEAERAPLTQPAAMTRGQQAGAERRRGAWLHLAVLALFAIATALMVPDYVRQPFSVPDHGDPLFSIWRLAWVAHQLPRDPLHLFDGNIFYPEVRTLAFSDAMLVPALAAAPLLWLGVHQVLVYHLIFFLAIVFSGYTAFLLVRTLTANTGAALISGLLFAFCFFRFLHFSHLELQVSHWMPLALYAFHRTVITGRVRFGVLTGVAIALQALSSLYYGLFFVVFLAVVALALWVSRHFVLRTVARPLIAGAVVAAVIVLPLTTPYWLNRSTVGERSRDEVEFFSARPSDFLAAPGASVYRGRFTQTPEGERELFTGFTPVVLSAVAVWPPLAPIRFAYAAGLLFAMDAALGFHGEAYHWLHAYVPGFRGLRAPARFGMIMALALSILAGYGTARIAARLRNRRTQYALFAVTAVAIMIEMRPTVRIEHIWPTAPTIYDALPKDRKVVIAEFPFPRPDGGFWHDARYMYFSTFHWTTLVNGNSGFIPYPYLVLIDKVVSFPSDDSVKALRARGAEYIVLHQHFHFPQDYAKLVTEVDQRRDFTLVAISQWENSEVRLYQLHK